MKQKTFLLVSQVFSFRHAKQTSKNVADTTFNYHYDSNVSKKIIGKEYSNFWPSDMPE